MTSSSELDGTDDLLRAEFDRLLAENEGLRRQLGDRDAPDGSPWWRKRWLSVLCAVLGAVVLPMAVFTVWARNTLLDTEQYVATVAPLAEDPAIQQAVGAQVARTVAEAADFESIATEVLPPEAALLAAPIAAGAESLISEIAIEVIVTREFALLWEEANREAHGAVVPLITGQGDEFLQTENGQVVVDIGAIAEEVVKRLDERLDTELSSQISAEELQAEVVLVDSPELADVQGGVRLLDQVAWLSVILLVVFLVATVVTAERRRLGVRRLGFALAVPALLALIAYDVASSEYANAAADGGNDPTALVAVFSILTSFLQRSLVAVLVLGVIVLIVAWMTGPSSSAAWAHGLWGSLVGRVEDSTAGREVHPAARWISDNVRTLTYGLLGLGGLVALLWTRPTGLVILVIALVTGLAVAGVRLVAEAVAGSASEPQRASPESGDEPRSELDSDETIEL